MILHDNNTKMVGYLDRSHRSPKTKTKTVLFSSAAVFERLDRYFGHLAKTGTKTFLFCDFYENGLRFRPDESQDENES